MTTLTMEGILMETLQDTVKLLAGGVVVVHSPKIFLCMMENMYPSYPKRRCRP